MYAGNYHSYTHLITVSGIVREPTLCSFINPPTPLHTVHDIGRATQVQFQERALGVEPHHDNAGTEKGMVQFFGEGDFSDPSRTPAEPLPLTRATPQPRITITL